MRARIIAASLLIAAGNKIPPQKSGLRHSNSA
jgi:hypothetical protein